MLSLAALSLSAAGFFASSVTLSRTADAGRACTLISLANAVTNGMLPGSKFCLNVKLCVRPERRDEFIACIRDNQKGTLSTEPLAVEYVWGEDVAQPNTFHFYGETLPGSEPCHKPALSPFFPRCTQRSTRADGASRHIRRRRTLQHGRCSRRATRSRVHRSSSSTRRCEIG